MKKPVKKIYVNKNDSCATVVHKAISAGLDEFILYIPKEAEIAKNPKNFKLLKREVSAVGKKIVIESVDDNILKTAVTAGFEVMDGLFSRSVSSLSKTPLIDIIPAKSKLESLSESRASKNPLISKELNKINLSEETEKDSSKNQLSSFIPNGENPSSAIETEEHIHSQPKKFLFKKISFIIISITSIALAGYLAFFILPSASISIDREKINWPFTGIITASIKAPSVSSDDSLVPAQIFTVSKNGIFQFPASDVEMIKRRASGKITIWNAYSSKTQTLVRNTRFVTPEGKIYRITSSVIVPGAKIFEGRIQPSSIEANVIADIEGETHNTGPIAKLRIPGFKGTPKYDGFYGEFKTNISGGFIGEMRVPTKTDIERARKESIAKVTALVNSSITMTIPPEFKVVDNAVVHNITKNEIVSEADEKGEFSYGVIIEAKVPAYRESDIIALLTEKFKKEKSSSYDLIEKNLTYTSDRVVNASLGKISIPIEFKSTWARSFDSEAFRNEILGVSEKSLKSAVFAIPGVINAKIDLWPFWVASVPMAPDKIKINVN